MMEHPAKAAVPQTLQEKQIWLKWRLSPFMQPFLGFVSVTMVQLKALYEGPPSDVPVKDGGVIVAACAQC
jgi:hypothetical protein